MEWLADDGGSSPSGMAIAVKAGAPSCTTACGGVLVYVLQSTPRLMVGVWTAMKNSSVSSLALRYTQEMRDARARHGEPITMPAQWVIAVSAPCAGCEKTRNPDSKFIAKPMALASITNGHLRDGASWCWRGYPAYCAAG